MKGCWILSEALSASVEMIIWFLSFSLYSICYNIASVFMFWFFGWEACGILAPWPGIKPAPPALEVQSLNHQTTREVPKIHWIFVSMNYLLKQASLTSKLLECYRITLVLEYHMVQVHNNSVFIYITPVFQNNTGMAFFFLGPYLLIIF